MTEYVATLRDVPTAQLHCMPGGFNPHWDSVTKPRRRGQFGIHINSRCGVCGKERTRILSSLSERTIQLYYVTPMWHVKVEEAYDAYDVARELARRLDKGEKVRRLRAVG
jgi:hypothetical protein